MNLLLEFDNDHPMAITFGFEEARKKICDGKWICEIIGDSDRQTYQFFVMKSHQIYKIRLLETSTIIFGVSSLGVYIDNLTEEVYTGFANWAISDEKRIFTEAQFYKNK